MEHNFTINFTKDQLSNAMDAEYKRTAGKYKIPGFRPGKAPRGVIEKHVGEDVFLEGAISMLFTDGYKKVLQENPDLEPIEPPVIDFDMEKGEIRASVGILKPFTLGEYKGLKVKREIIEVTDQQIESFLERLQQSRARQVDRDLIQKGDIAVIDFDGGFPGGVAQNYELEIGSNSFIDTFEEQLIGLRTGDKKDVNVKFPENYHEKSLAGQPATFKVVVNKVLGKELPEINDEFAKENSDFDTLEQFKSDIRKNLEQRANIESEKHSEEKLINAVIEKTKLDVPEKMVTRQTDRMIAELEHSLASQGMNLGIYLDYLNKTMEDLRKEYQKHALNIIKTRLVFDKIAAAEGLKIQKDPETTFNNILEFLKKNNEII